MDNLCLECPGMSVFCIHGSKRKRSAGDSNGSGNDISLMLSLGHSWSLSGKYNTGISTGCMHSKQTDEGTSSSRPLNLDLNVAYVPCLDEPTLTTAKVWKTKSHQDLQLSLVPGQTASVVTNSSFNLHGDLSGASISAEMLSVANDGSVSSRWTSVVSSQISFQDAQMVKNHSTDWTNSVIISSDLAAPTCLPACSALKSSATNTIGVPNIKLQRTSGIKVCKFQGCAKGARGASGLCIAHGGGRRCQRDGCNKGAEGRTAYCKAHGGGRRCQFLGCTKSAEGRTDYCIAHGGGRRCSHENCSRAARGKSGLCIRHGGGKRCQKEKCTKSAEGYSGFCIAHGGGRRCQFSGCTKGAQGSTFFCKAHGGGKRCTAPGCNKGAEGSTQFCKGHGGGKRCSFEGGGVCPKSVHGGTMFCVAHGGGKRCATPDCTRSARGRTSFCVRHGGGKRCKVTGCGKSAQGRTDFCKSHGGGTRCSWGHASSKFGDGDVPCDRFARGRSGFCTSHSVMVDTPAYGGGSLAPGSGITKKLFLPEAKNQEAFCVEGVHANKHVSDFSGSKNAGFKLAVQNMQPQLDALALPEGRVHGGNLMAMLSTCVGKDGLVSAPVCAVRLSDPEAAGLGAPWKWM